MKTVCGTLIAADMIDNLMVDVTLRLEWRHEFEIISGAKYLVAFERGYEPPPQIESASPLPEQEDET